VARIRWGHEWIPPEAPVKERILPDGAVHLLFAVSGSGGRPYGLALGASSEARVIPLAGRIEHVEIELRAGAVPALLGVPAGELSGRAVALEDLWGGRAAEARDRLLGASGAAERLGVVHQILRGALGESPKEPPPALAEALRRISSAGGNLRVHDLAARLGVSDRRLEQLFHFHVGLSPKVSCRLARLRMCLELLASEPGRPWAEIALDGGFSDQSHLVNEFRALTGLAPGELQRRAGFGFLQDGAAAGRYLPGKRPRRSGT
jgi:AraC-like DNA-binding protein